MQVARHSEKICRTRDMCTAPGYCQQVCADCALSSGPANAIGRNDFDQWCRKSWPPSLRNCACGHLQNLAEFWPNVDHMGGPVPLLESMIVLCNSKIPLLELCGARGISRSTFHVPEGCPTPQMTLDECKATVAHGGGIPALTGLLQRLNKRQVSTLNLDIFTGGHYSIILLIPGIQ